MEEKLCVQINVIRCQLCAQEKDSMQSLSVVWHTTWTEIWSGNHLLLNPDLIQVSGYHYPGSLSLKFV